MQNEAADQKAAKASKNKSGLRSLDRVNNDPRIAEVYRDSDGIWIEVNAGFTCEQGGAHGGHEWNAKDALRVIRGIAACVCAECQAASLLKPAYAVGAYRTNGVNGMREWFRIKDESGKIVATGLYSAERAKAWIERAVGSK